MFSMAIISKVGGASGPLFTVLMFMNLMKATKGVEQIDSQEQLGEFIREGANGIQEEKGTRR